jgi:outer membrane protein TolC
MFPRALLNILLSLGVTASGRAQAGPPARPLSLEDALQIALPASEAVGLARAAVTRSNGEQLRARSEFFPQLTGSASYSRLLKSQFSGFAESDTSTGPARPNSCDRFFSDPTLPIGERVDSLEKSLECVSAVNPFGSLGSLPFGRANTWNLGLSLSQTLFSGGRVMGQVQAANAGRRSANIGLSTAEAQLTLDVVQTYFDAALAQQLAAISQAALDQADSALRETTLRRSLGTVPEFDLLRARVTRDNQRAVAIQRASDRELAGLRLKQLLDLPTAEPIGLVTALDDSALAATPSLQTLVAEAGDTSTERRAPVRQAAEGVVAQEGLLKVARSQHYPSVSLTSAYGKVGYPSSALPSWNDFLTNWNLAVGLQLPLFTGGRIKGDNLVAQAGLDEARLRLRQTMEYAQLDAQNSLQQLASAREALRASQGTAEQADRAYQIADLRFREGISTHIELLDARLALEQSRANRALAARDLQVARVRVALISRLPLAGATATTPITTSSRSTQRQAVQPQSAAATGSGIP